jgi:hypothetical protein
MFWINDGCKPLTVANGLSQEVAEWMAVLYARSAKARLRESLLIEMREERDRVCGLLGFSNWDGYWSSLDWKRIRRKILKHANKICLKCGGRANQVHHRSYAIEVLKGNNDEQLAPICAGCHNVVHGDEFGNKYSMDEWDAILFNKELRTEVSLDEVDHREQSRLIRGRPASWNRMSAVQRAAWKERSQPKTTSLAANRPMPRPLRT